MRASLNRTNLLRLGASLILALILWGWVSTIEDPKRDRTFADLPIAVQDLGEGLVITTDIPNVRVNIDGPRSDIERVNTAAVMPYIDMANITEPGQYTINVDLEHIDGLWHTELTPNKLTLTVERQTSKDFTLETEISGESGSTRRIGDVRAATTTVTVTGAESQVASVAKVVLPITIENQARDFVNSFTPVARDAAGNDVTGVTISPDTVSATVPISSRGKQVTVIVQTAGQPADGYTVTSRVANPQTVTVDGPDDVIQSMIAVNTRPVDIQNATATVQESVEIADLPPNVSVIDPSGGEVAVQVGITQEGVRQELAGQTITHINLGAGLGVEIQPSETTVVVNGSDEALSALQSGDITVQVDLEGLGPGTYTLPLKVLVAQGLEWVSSSPSEVTVRIVSVTGSSGATPEPASSPTAPTEAILPEPTPTPGATP